MREYALAAGLTGVVACSGSSAFESQERDSAPNSAGGSGHDGSPGGTGGSAGTISLDASRDASPGGGFTGCSPEATLRIESEDGGGWCSIALPAFADGGRNYLNLRFTKQDGDTGLLPFVGSASACDSDGGNAEGWFYYATDAAERIGLCPAACALITLESEGAVTVIKGCVNPILPE